VRLRLEVGDKESTVRWRNFFEDLKSRGSQEPLLAINDGNSGLRRTAACSGPNRFVHARNSTLSRLNSATAAASAPAA
jgi:transposase-like protein